MMKTQTKEIREEGFFNKIKRYFIYISLTLPLFYSGIIRGGFFPTELFITILLILIPFLIFIFLINKNQQPVRISGLELFIFLFLFITFLSLFFTVYLHASIIEFYKWAGIIILFYMVLNFAKGKSSFYFLFYFIAVLGLMLSLIGFVSLGIVKAIPESIIAKFIQGWGIIKYGAISSTLQYQNVFGAFLILPIFLALSLVIQAKGIRKVILLFITVLLLLSLIFTTSRGAILVFIVTFIFYFAFLKRNEKKELLLYIGIAVLLLVALVIFKKDVLMPIFIRNFEKALVFIDFLKGIKNPQTESINKRVIMILDSLRVLKDYPLFGTGSGTYQYIYRQYRSVNFFSAFPHSIVSQIFSELGILGGISFLFLSISSLWKTFKLSLKNADNKLLLSGLVFGNIGIFLHALIDFDWSFYFMPLLFFFVVALILTQGEERYIYLKKVSEENLSRSTEKKAQFKEEKKQLSFKKQPQAASTPFSFKNFLKSKSFSLLKIFLIVFIFLLISLLFGHRFYRKAEEASQKMDLERAANFYKKAILFDSLNASYHYELGKLYSTMMSFGGDQTIFLPRIFEEYKKAVELAPTYPNYRYSLAELYYNVGNTKAVDEFKKTVESDPFDTNAHSALGFALLNMENDPANATREFDKAIECDPKNFGAYLGKGMIFLQEGNKKEAIENFQKSAELDPKNFQARYQLALVYREEKNLIEEIVWLKQTLEANSYFQEAKTRYEEIAPIVKIENLKDNNTVHIKDPLKIGWQIMNSKTLNFPYKCNFILQYKTVEDKEWIDIMSLKENISEFNWKIPENLIGKKIGIRVIIYSNDKIVSDSVVKDIVLLP